MKKRITSILLAFAMVLTLLPAVTPNCEAQAVCIKCREAVDAVCPGCSYCRDCDVNTKHCKGCEWGKDCAAKAGVAFCDDCENCKNCCACPPKSECYKCDKLVSTVCPACNWCAECDRYPHCPDCNIGKDCAKDWCDECNKCKKCCNCAEIIEPDTECTVCKGKKELYPGREICSDCLFAGLCTLCQVNLLLTGKLDWCDACNKCECLCDCEEIPGPECTLCKSKELYPGLDICFDCLFAGLCPVCQVNLILIGKLEWCGECNKCECLCDCEEDIPEEGCILCKKDDSTVCADCRVCSDCDNVGHCSECGMCKSCLEKKDILWCDDCKCCEDCCECVAVPPELECYICGKKDKTICRGCEFCAECDKYSTHCKVCGWGIDCLEIIDVSWCNGCNKCEICCSCLPLDLCKECGDLAVLCPKCSLCGKCDFYDHCGECGRGMNCTIKVGELWCWNCSSCEGCCDCGEFDPLGKCIECGVSEEFCLKCRWCADCDYFEHCPDCGCCEFCQDFLWCWNCGSCAECCDCGNFNPDPPKGVCRVCKNDAALVCSDCFYCVACSKKEHCPDCGRCVDCLKAAGVLWCEECDNCEDCCISEPECFLCGKKDETVCPACKVCAACDKYTVHCKGCGWGRDCFEADGGTWCEKCDNCEECCECEDIIPPEPECFLCGKKDETVCPACEVCAACDKYTVHCKGCGWGRDCFEVNGGTWCEKCKNCSECCKCVIPKCVKCKENPVFCPGCGYCFDCDSFERCPGCKWGRDCLKSEGVSWCKTCNKCGNCCFCVVYMGGDVNGDGKIDVNDALEILKFLGGLPSVISVKKGASNAPTISDALEILKYLGKMPNSIPKR